MSRSATKATTYNDNTFPRIVDKLLTLTPDNFDDVDALVRFSIEMLTDVYGADAKSGAGIRLLRNASAGISTAKIKLVQRF